jgi:hypothetical protein
VPISTRALLLSIAAIALLAGCGKQGNVSTGAGKSEDQAAETHPVPDRPSKSGVAAERTVDSYLQALALGDEAACGYLTDEFMGRIARGGEYSSSRSDIRRILCDTHARDLTGHGELTLTRSAISVERASAARATVTVSATLAEVEASSYSEEDTPREATVTSTYHLVRHGGRWRINDITEDSFHEYGGGEVSGPLSSDFGGNLVLIRGCETSEESYCEPLIGH